MEAHGRVNPADTIEAPIAGGHKIFAIRICVNMDLDERAQPGLGTRQPASPHIAPVSGIPGEGRRGLAH